MISGRTAVTGLIDLRGKVQSVGKLKGKILYCKQNRFVRVVIPQADLDALLEEGLPDKAEREYVDLAVRWARNFVEVLQHTTQGPCV